jgi:uncharacterized protein (DUF2141 family)
MKQLLLCLFFLFGFNACQNKAAGQIFVFVFFDADGNGVQNDTEAGIENVLVELVLNPQNPRKYTPPSGEFTFTPVSVGPDEILVTPPPGMRVTTSNARTRVNVFENTITNVVFGVGKSLSVGSVTGSVFEDTNGDGTRDGSEPGVAKAILDLSTVAGTVATVQTDASGFYQADGVLSGDVTVRIRDSCGVKPSNGAIRVARVYTGDQTSIQAFGILPIQPRVSGLVFNDANGNGVQDSNELGLPGWTVYADLNNNSQYDLVEPAVATCSDGGYALENVPDGPVSIRHVMNLGYTSSLAVIATLKASNPVKPYIVGGQSAPSGAYPFMASLVRSSAINPYSGAFCGGSLIAPSWILSAAHCLENITPENVDVVLGTNRLENSVIRIRAAQIVVHPDYDTVTQDYDLALIKLSRGVNFPTVQPLLPFQTNLSLTGAKATVIGWGDQDFGAGKYPVDLREALVPIYDQETCNTNYAKLGGITPRMICAGYSQGRIDSCQGDSGGPLLVSSGIAGLWRQTGIVSNGYRCAEPNFPGIYTRVTEFNSFLEAQLGRGLASVYNVSLPIGGSQTGVSFAVR